MTDADQTGSPPPPADWHARERALLAPWAMHAADSAGREHPEESHPFRSPYQRDRDRIVHSAAFRRLAHKTQVFTDYPGDFHHASTMFSGVRWVARTITQPRPGRDPFRSPGCE